MIASVLSIGVFVGFVAGCLLTEFEQKRASLRRRRNLEERFRRDDVNYRREIFEGRLTLPLHPETPWYDQPDERELMDRKGITFEDVQKAMRQLAK